MSTFPLFSPKRLTLIRQYFYILFIPDIGISTKNVLPDQEIQEADCIIVAADAKVPMDRFDGKKVIECQVSDGISKADQLVDRAISGDVPIFHAAAGSQSSSSNAKAGG